MQLEKTGALANVCQDEHHVPMANQVSPQYYWPTTDLATQNSTVTPDSEPRGTMSNVSAMRFHSFFPRYSPMLNFNVGVPEPPRTLLYRHITWYALQNRVEPTAWWSVESLPLLFQH